MGQRQQQQQSNQYAHPHPYKPLVPRQSLPVPLHSVKGRNHPLKGRFQRHRERQKQVPGAPASPDLNPSCKPQSPFRNQPLAPTIPGLALAARGASAPVSSAAQFSGANRPFSPPHTRLPARPRPPPSPSNPLLETSPEMLGGQEETYPGLLCQN